MANWVDINTIDKTIPFCRAAYNVDYRSDETDQWMSEKPDTDEGWAWNGGTTEVEGYYTYHRWNRNQVTCVFSSVLSDEIPEGYTESTRGNDGFGGTTYYGLSIRDYKRYNLPLETINGVDYRVIDYRDFQGYVPLYKCKAVVDDGSLLVDIDLGGGGDSGEGQTYSLASDAGIVTVPLIGSSKTVKIINKNKNIYRI